MVEPYPDRTIRCPFRLDGDRAERQGRGEGCEGGGADRDFDHAGDIGPARASRQNSPRAGEVQTRGPGQEFKGTPSRLGGPPGCSVASPMPSPPIGDEGLFQAASSDIGGDEAGVRVLRTPASRFHGGVVKRPRLPPAPLRGRAENERQGHAAGLQRHSLRALRHPCVTPTQSHDDVPSDMRWTSASLAL